MGQPANGRLTRRHPSNQRELRRGSPMRILESHGLKGREYPLPDTLTTS